MNKSNYGMSFPFRVGVKGGLRMSGVNSYEYTHINESIFQILTTKKGERVNESYYGSDIDIHLFDPDDLSLQNLLQYEVAKSLSDNEPRIIVTKDDVSIESFEQFNGGHGIAITVQYKLKDYVNAPTQTTTVNIGSVY